MGCVADDEGPYFTARVRQDEEWRIPGVTVPLADPKEQRELDEHLAFRDRLKVAGLDMDDNLGIVWPCAERPGFVSVSGDFTPAQLRAIADVMDALREGR